MQEHSFSTARSARYFTLGAPERAAEFWFVYHGYGQLASRFLERFRSIESERRCIVAPEGLSRFYLSESPAERRVGASWMTRGDRLPLDGAGVVAHRPADCLGWGGAARPRPATSPRSQPDTRVRHARPILHGESRRGDGGPAPCA